MTEERLLEARHAFIEARKKADEANILATKAQAEYAIAKDEFLAEDQELLNK